MRHKVVYSRRNQGKTSKMKKNDIENRPYITRENIANSKAPGLTLTRQRVVDAELHYHDFFELSIVVSGSGFHITQQGEFQIVRGNVFLTRPSYVHGCRQGNNLEVISILFFPDLLDFSFDSLHQNQAFQTFFQTAPKLSDSFRFRNNFMLAPESVNSVNEIVRQIELEQKLKQPDSRFAINLLFMNLLLTLLRSIFSQKSKKNMEMLQINQILHYIATHYHNELYPTDIARKFGFSIRSLERLFRNSLDISPCAYICNFRLNKSLELLENTTLPITTVAMKSGFPDNCYYSKCFTRKFKISPREYRSQKTS